MFLFVLKVCPTFYPFVTITAILHHGLSENRWREIPVFEYVDIRVSPCPTEVPLFLSGLFGDYVELFNLVW